MAERVAGMLIARNNNELHRLALLINRCGNFRRKSFVVENKETLTAVSDHFTTDSVAQCPVPGGNRSFGLLEILGCFLNVRFSRKQSFSSSGI